MTNEQRKKNIWQWPKMIIIVYVMNEWQIYECVSQICYSNQSLDHVRAAFQRPFICLYNTPLKLGYMCVPHVWCCLHSRFMIRSGVSKVNPGSRMVLLCPPEGTRVRSLFSVPPSGTSLPQLFAPLSLLYTWSSLTLKISVHSPRRQEDAFPASLTWGYWKMSSV